MVVELAAQLEKQPFAVAIAEGAWLFPGLEIAHVLSIALVVGSIGMVDLRLMGAGATDLRASEFIRSVLPWTWTAFAVAAVAGSLMFVSRATSYVENPYFQAKLLLLLLAGVNMLGFHYVTARNMASWELGRPPRSARASGALSLLLWVSTVTMGRFMGFV